MIDAAQVKQLAMRYGADLCGIAPVRRFDGAPAGFHLIYCNACRKVCPDHLGRKNRSQAGK